MKVGGKPRYLGLILTGLLLLALVAVAAWSRLSLSSNEVDPNLSPTESAPIQTADLPSAEDEALADGQDIGTETDVAADVTNDATEPAVDQSLAVAGSEPSAGPSVLGDAVAAAKPGGDPQDEIFLASLDQAPQTLDAMLLPAPVGSNDPPPQLAAPPPPFGTVYTFDATGRIQPTPEGIITPEGVMLVAGAPKKLPPARPAALTQAAAPADNATTADQEAATVTAEVKTVQTFEADPSLAGKKPRLRPEGLVASQPEAEDSPTESLAPEARFADIRPARRPDSLTTPPPADPASAASLAAAGLADGSSLAIPISRKPAARPSGMDQAVDAAVAAALQSTDDVASTDQGESQAPEAQAEPEVEAPAPDIPTNASVAKQATDKNALNLNKIALIGIFGTASSRYAMVRLGGGGIKRVKVGDTLDGGRVAAITATELQYQKGGRMLTLTLPRG